jgi:hypothetical protein
MKPSLLWRGPRGRANSLKIRTGQNPTDTNFPSWGTGLALGAAYEYLVTARRPNSLLFFILSIFVGKMAGSNNIHARRNRYCFGLVRFSWKRDCAIRYKFPCINVAQAVLPFFHPSRPAGISHRSAKQIKCRKAPVTNHQSSSLSVSVCFLNYRVI